MPKPDLQLWCEGVVKGKIVSGEKIKQLAQMLLNDLENPGKWRFDRRKAERAVYFIEHFCYIPSGRIGQPFKMELYEKAIVETIFGFVSSETGLRRYNEVLIIVARKNGKTSLMAAIEWYMLVADGEGAPQIYNLATTGDQAKLGFNACLRMRRQSKAFRAKTRKRTDDIYFPYNMGSIKPMYNNPDSLDGLDVSCAVMDEIHAMKTRELYDVVKQGTSARKQPLMLQITTAGFVRNSIYDAQYKYASDWLKGDVAAERFVAFVWELDDRDEWDKPKCWPKANPGLGVVKSEEYLAEQVAKAKADPSYLPTVLTKDFNMPQNSATAWLSFEEAVNEEPFELKRGDFRYCVAGFDYAETTDLTAGCALMMRPGDDRIYAHHMYWIPEEALAEKADLGKDRDEAPYRLWISRGLMRTVPGNKMDNSVLVQWLEELKSEYDVYTFAVGYDPWHIQDTSAQLQLEQYVGKSRSFQVRQGTKTLSMPMKQLKADYRANRIVDGHNPIDEWCRMNVQVKADTNNEIQPCKKQLNPKNRIDGFMAELISYIVLCDLMDDYQGVV